MAFKDLFKKRSEEPKQQTSGGGVTLGDPGTLSDVLLQALISGGKITREMVLSIPAVSADRCSVSRCWWVCCRSCGIWA